MKLKYDFDLIDMDIDKIAIPMGKDSETFHGLIRLNESAGKIFELLKEDISLEELVDALDVFYEVDREIIKLSVQKYLDRMKKDGLLE